MARALAYDLARQPAVFRWLAAIPSLGIGETHFDPEFRRVYYDPEVGPIPMIKRGRGPGEPVPYKVFDDPEPASAAAASSVR